MSGDVDRIAEWAKAAAEGGDVVVLDSVLSRQREELRRRARELPPLPSSVYRPRGEAKRLEVVVLKGRKESFGGCRFIVDSGKLTT